MGLKKVILFLLLTAMVFVNCGGDNEEENKKPVAAVGANVTIKIGETVNLDGSGSADLDGDKITYLWKISARPAGSVCTIADKAAKVTSFVPDKVGEYTITLVVNDGKIDSDTATMTVTVNLENPDLLPFDLSCNKSSVMQDDSVQIQSKVSNLSKSGNAGGFQVGYYLSTDTTITKTDILLGYSTVTSLAFQDETTVSSDLIIPASVAGGNYYVGVIVDPNGNITESNEANNSSYIASTLTVIAKTINILPLAASAPASAMQNDTINVSYTLTNTGNQASGNMRVGVYLSEDATVTTGDTLIGNVTIALSAESKTSGTISCVIPAISSEKTYYIAVIADDQSTVTETNESDNTSSVMSIALTPKTINLKSLSVSAPATTASGSTISVAYSVTNSGNQPTGTARVGIYLSEDSTITTSDTLIGSKTISLSGESKETGTISCVIPYTTAKKTYYIGMIADDQSAVSETSESDNVAVSTASANSPQSVDWVVMIYMAADNTLSSAADGDISEIKNANLNGQSVRVVTLVDQQGSGNTRLYEFFKNTEVRLSSTELGLSGVGSEELNTGTKNTLENFIQYCKAKYPATKYSLILWNHGEGWRSVTRKSKIVQINLKKKATSSKSRSICQDTTSDSMIGNNDIQAAVTGKGINLLCMDACLMAMVEVAYEMRTSVTGIEYLVASQNTEPGSGYQYTTLLNSFISASDKSSLNFATIAVNDYVNSYSSGSDVTQSAIDLSKIGDVVTKINNFVTFLGGQTQADLDIARANTEQYADPAYVDLYHFANKFSDTTASELKTAISSAVVANASRSGKPNAHGLSINFSTVVHDSTYTDSNNTRNIDFLNDSTWDNFLTGRAFGLTIDAYEPNYDSSTATIAHNGSIFMEYIIDAYDSDVHKITPTSTGTLTVSLTSMPSDCDYNIYLLDSSNMVAWELGLTPYAISGSAQIGNGVSEYFSYNITSTSSSYYLIVQTANGISLTDSYALFFGGTASY